MVKTYLRITLHEALEKRTKANKANEMWSYFPQADNMPALYVLGQLVLRDARLQILLAGSPNDVILLVHCLFGVDLGFHY